MLWGPVLSEYVLGYGSGELGGGRAVGLGVEEVAEEGHCCLRHCGWGISGCGIGCLG